jgi:hypothetical protein
MAALSGSEHRSGIAAVAPEARFASIYRGFFWVILD